MRNSRGIVSQQQPKSKSGHPVAPQTYRTKSSFTDGHCPPLSASFLTLPASQHEPEITLSPSNNLCEFTYALLMLRGILGIVGLVFVYGCMGPAILTCYWTNIYHLQLFSFPKWNFPLRNEVTAGSSKMSLQDFLSNFCAGSGTHLMSILTPGSSLPLGCAVSPGSVSGCSHDTNALTKGIFSLTK